jgi:hypothetical protein
MQKFNNNPLSGWPMLAMLFVLLPHTAPAPADENHYPSSAGEPLNPLSNPADCVYTVIPYQIGSAHHLPVLPHPACRLPNSRN